MNASRGQVWRPSPRPDWVRKVNEEGRHMDLEGVVPLDENSLLATARANTGLSDFGVDDWHEPFKILLDSLKREANLNLIGRIMTRADLLLFLEARLQIEDTIRNNPQILDEEIREPIMIIGQGRSGTSALHNMLSMDPANGVLKEWEITYPCPPPEAETYADDPRIEKAAGYLGMITRVIPEVHSMHEFGADMPMECIKLHGLTFNSPAWFNPFGGEAPSYSAAMAKRSVVPVYEYEKRVLKLLQWRNPRKRWLLKSPYSINHLPDILKVFPDMGFAWIHRDPIKALASVVNLIGTLLWCRSDHPFSNFPLEAYTDAETSAAMLSQPITWIENGVLPKANLCNVQYLDFVEDALSVAVQIYEGLGLELTEQALAAMRQYMQDSPRAKRPPHRYSVGSSESVDAKRAAFETYQDYFDVPSEV